MAGRRRLGVAVLVEGAAAAEIDGLRRALGDPALGRIPPHVTLVPPINVRAADLGPALTVLRAAAARCPGPLELTVGRPATFLPENPVLYLGVGGDGPGLRALRDAVFVAPLARDLTWPWVPHVTLADGVDEGRIEAGLRALDRYAAVVSVGRVVLLEETRPGPRGSGRRWVALADAALGPPVVVGRGGLDLTLVEGREIDPEAAEVLAGSAPPPAPVDPEATGAHQWRVWWARPRRQPLVLTARREETTVGVGLAWLADDGAHLAVVVGPDHRGRGTGTQLLAHLESRVAERGWEVAVIRASGPARFYRERSRWSVPDPGPDS